MYPPIYSYITQAVPALGGRVYRERTSTANPATPYAVWAPLAAVPENNLSQRPPGDRVSISVDVFASTEQQLDTVTAACRDAIEAHGHVLTVQSLGQETDTGLWRSTFDADIFHTR